MEEQNKALIRRWFEEVWNRGRLDLIAEMRSPEAIVTGLEDGNAESRGEKPFIRFYATLREALPDLYLNIEDVIAEGDKVAVRITAEGTHKTEALGFPATHRKVRFSTMVMARISGGKIVQAWNLLDQLELLRQIGALPPGMLRDNYLLAR